MFSNYYKRNLEVTDIFDIIKRVKEKKISGIIDLELYKQSFEDEYACIFQ